MSTPRNATIIPYLKTIWILQNEEMARVGVTILSERLSKATATVSQTVRTLADARLIHHEPYGPIELTLKGEQLALKVIRNDRVARAFLYRVLDYPWPDVAREANTLMLVLHDDLANRLHQVSGSPLTDPYGNPIPGTKGEPNARKGRPLGDQPRGVELEILRVSDTDQALLDRFDVLGLTPGQLVRIEHMDHTTGVIYGTCNNTALTIGVQAASRVLTARSDGKEHPKPTQSSSSTQTASVAARPSVSRPDRPSTRTSVTSE
ncbi:metal-dependent transcriptional regulator [Leucobacter manosquensis]|uniref:Manganese transport regulator n=1 Tax=Leucobacter manosquensis TaxID=2810611 RepID=A0ABS5M628_9MICO|nr:metal-dependent transcriptional regulator [Leucobacter manosquensis]MBS3182426.1 metal-dependent transcriptional regulator [Leucobacter manosquensis]